LKRVHFVCLRYMVFISHDIAERSGLLNGVYNTSFDSNPKTKYHE